MQPYRHELFGGGGSLDWLVQREIRRIPKLLRIVILLWTFSTFPCSKQLSV